MFDIFIKWVIPFALTGVVGILSKALKDLKKMRSKSDVDHNAMKNSMIAILRCVIVEITEKYFLLGYLPDHARSTLQGLFENYTELGGNHGIDELIQQSYKLPPVVNTKKSHE